MTQRKKKTAVFEVDVAERLIQYHGDGLRYVTGIGWLVWVGTHWERDEQDKSREAVKDVLKKLRTEAAAVQDDELWKLCKSVSTARGENRSQERTPRTPVAPPRGQERPGEHWHGYWQPSSKEFRPVFCRRKNAKPPA